ncbi:MAG: hypothetical protein P1U38_13315 [Aeromicrobium sp.]|uniref:hypothetical protein n=1 Tax=Aeromicrobium sp. TaxID=1871063 RepID=UPI0025C48646|nr:hypothetical protein [Aeromicrobium sp.]MCK5892239.1 hypothetical protein [Aeromicrobium sp.]MDF1705744.1 hypothetical protein [Aeromicrobium sp.]
MTGDIEVSGGAGGVAASYEDMLTQADVLDLAGDDLREVGTGLAGMFGEGDVWQAAVLCPGEVAAVQVAIVEASSGPDGALWAGGEVEVTARYLRVAVDVYRFADATLAAGEEALWTAGGWTFGAVLPVAAVGAAGVLITNPELVMLLLGDKDELLNEVEELAYDDPWLLEALTRMAPGAVQGTSFTLAALVPLGPLALMGLTRGRWPSGDYETSVAGLAALARNLGHLRDTGEFGVAAAGGPSDLRIDERHAVETIFDQQAVTSAHDGRIQIITLEGHPPSYVVQIPGTQDWSSQRGDNPVDLTTNVALMAGDDTVMAGLVADAMREAGITPGAPVMLTGHSQGGITAMTMAADPDLQREFSITSVVTGGSPVGRIDVPDGVSVLSLEHTQDVVPMLDGADNPDRPEWTTVRRELSDAEGGGGDAADRGPGGAHSLDNYAATGAAADASHDSSLERWRDDNRSFFGSGQAQQYQIGAMAGG